MLTCFDDFCAALLESGFSMGGGNAKGIYAVVDFDWQTVPENCPIRWHTGDPETDPWEWRMRVLEERSDIAYAKVFFGVSGYITKAWYPQFLAVRRGGCVFEEWYEAGKATQMEKRVYQALETNGRVPLHELKTLCGVTKETSARFDRALLSLQKSLFITLCGRAQKRNKFGEAYGWNSTVFCTVEEFWGQDLDAGIPPQQAYDAIRAHILQLNPNAQEKAIKKFILG